MKSISLYVNTNSLIHAIDPITKLIYTLVFMSIPFILPYHLVAVACLFFTLIILLIAKVIKQLIPIVGFSLFLVFTIFLIQGLFYPGNSIIAFKVLGSSFYQEGLDYALGIFLRFMNLLCCSSIIIFTTKPSDLIESLVRRGLHPKLGYIMSSVLQIIPQMVSTTQTILDAQRSRGMETEGNLLTRVRAYIPLLGPLVINSLIETNERSMALEIRAFNSKRQKTFLHEEKIPPGMVLLRFIIIFLLVGAVVWRIMK